MLKYKEKFLIYSNNNHSDETKNQDINTLSEALSDVIKEYLQKKA
jgi:hypothetical protein